METGKPGLASAPAHMSSVAAQTEQRMDVQAPLTAVYFHTVPALPTQPFSQPPFAAQDPSALHLTMPPLYSKETLPFLTLHIASGLQPGMSMTAAAPAAKPKSSGKHMCPHCGRDCMKPSVLEKHLRCHTGERPYPCTVCGVSFKTQSNLYKHKRTQAHARLSSESEQSNLGSLDSMSCSTETTSLSVEERSDESAGAEKNASLPVAEKIPVVNQTLEQNEQSLKAQEYPKLPKQDDKPTTETERPTPLSGRHVLLQRQEATLFSKQWENSVSSSKSQSHESTDSGFSESSDHYPSPGSLLPDHSMDSLTESTTEHLEDSASQQQETQEGKDTTKEQEHKTLEERISKLISENSAVVEDKHLENVRPRKTVLSKQGSIDLPMPYTYKDSFHFDMRINKMSNAPRNRKPGLYNSVPTQPSTTMEHAPLTRSNSLPFSVTLLQPDRSSPTTSYHKDYTTLFRRGSSGQIHPTGFSNKSVNQQLPTHRPLVRQAAVDCNHATDALFKNSSVEEACTSSLLCNGEPADICGEPSNRKFRRKKAQKFAYNKWYMYGGGTFKKLYETERGGEHSTVKGMKSLPHSESEINHSLQKRQSAGHSETTVVSSPSLARSATVHNLESYPARLQLMPSMSFNTQTSHIFASSTPQRMPLRRNLSLSVLPLPILSVTSNQNIDPHTRSEASNLVNQRPYSASQSQVHIPSDRKKQRTDDKPCSQEMETDPNFTSQLTPSISTMPQPNLNQIIIQPKPAQVSLFPASTISANSPSASNSPATSISCAVQSSFMPKYQLKLPSAAESNSLNVGSKPTENNISALVSSVTTLASTKLETVTSIWTHQKDNNSSSAPSQILPCTVSQPQTPSQVNVISPSAIIQQHSMADTKTTTSLRNSHAGLFSTLIQCSPFGSAVPTTMSNKSISSTPFTSIHRTQSAPADFTALTQSQDHLSSQKSLPSPLTQSNQSSGSNADSNIPVMPCQVVPGQQAVPKVFHVQTADLQICFQIISDEQLALIEPQIEKQTVGSLSQTGLVHATGNQLQSSITPETIDKESDQRQPGENKEMDTPSKASATPSISNKSEKEQPNVHMTISTAQSPAMSTHPRICSQVNKVRKPLSPERAEVSTAASLKGAVSEKTQITQNKHVCHFAAQEQLLSDSQKNKDALASHALLDEQKPTAATVTSISHSPEKNERTNCVENEINFKNERDLCSMSKANNIPKVVPATYLISSSDNKQTCPVLQIGSDCGANETCTRPVPLFPNTDCRNSRQTSPHISVTKSNLQLSMVSSSLSQANQGPEKDGLTHGPTLAHDAGLEQSALVTSASTDVPLTAPRVAPAASPNLTTGPEEGGSLVGCAEPQSQGHSGAPVQLLLEQSHEPLGTDRTGLCYTHLESKAENCGVRADSFLTCWLSEQHLQPLSQMRSGMCTYPPQSSGPAPDLSNTPGLPASNTHTDFGNLIPPSSLLKTSCYLPQHTESGTEHSNKLKEPHLAETYQTVSHIEAGYQEIGTCQQDQRQVGGAESAVVSCSSTNYTSQSHTTELTGNSNSSVFKQSNTVYSEHISRDDPPQACDSLDGTSKFPSLFGMGHSYSYQLADPQSSAVRVVQSSIDVEDSSSDDEGKLIIEL